MEENTTVTESTTSAEGPEQDTVSEEAVSAPQETEQSGADTASQQEDTAADSTESDQSDSSDSKAVPFVTVKYNQEERGLSQEEAVSYAKKGIMYDEISPIYNKLDYLAAQSDTSVDKLVDGLITGAEETYRNSISEKLGENADSETVNAMVEMFRNKQKEKYDKILSDRKTAEDTAREQQKVSLETRLADEFRELKQEFPDIADFKSLPVSVKKAASDGKDLMSAYLFYLHREQQKISAAQSAAKEAEKASTGSAADKEKTDSVESEFLKGLWGR